MQYNVTVDDTFHFELPDDASQLDAVGVEKGKFHVLHENNSYDAQFVTSDFHNKKYTVRVNNTLYSVQIQNPLNKLIHEMGFEIGAGKQVNSMKAPMPGLILEISVTVGQSIAKNDPMIILGAMKMENSFLSPRDGIIKSIAIQVGDAVDKGQLLIEFE